MFFGVTRASGGSGRIRRIAARGSRMVRREPQFGNQMDAAAAWKPEALAPKPSGGSLFAAAGGARRLFAGVDCRPPGFDAG